MSDDMFIQKIMSMTNDEILKFLSSSTLKDELCDNIRLKRLLCEYYIKCITDKDSVVDQLKKELIW